jgi:hypothetical protein
VGLGRREKEEPTRRYYYVVYHWMVRGGTSGVGACTISNTAEEFLIGSVAEDIAKNTGRTVAIASWAEISENQNNDYLEYYESTKAGPTVIIEEVIRSKLNLKFEGDPFKIREWFEKPRKEWLLQSANELIKFGDASRVLEFLEKDE